ncbi:DUF262 domain-containing protein [Methylobacterium sp. Leaf112]|uniref:DUF262 domain-containing protein n=1 Tax=Methylobacterium sp. Leaf112 TaxID=1736258 RepID=UPI0009EAD48E|nr:DUF262 domain-containing protein [Methylobacterium sp. Leaf112]
MAKSPSDSKADFTKAPQPSVDRIEEVATRILTGDILLPKFQRNFVWSKGQILELWDSIAKNYPVGSVLLWRSREELQSERSIADLKIADTKEDYPVNYLLDGQQRLSSVCGAIFWNGSDAKSRWNIAYDLRHKKFLHLETLDSPPNHQIRLNWLPDPAQFFGQMARVSSETDAAALTAAGNELFRRFKDYKIATVTLLDMPMNDVAPIFERINSKGTPLTIVDLMRAATWSDSFDLIESIEAILSSIEEKGFENIDQKVVLRSFSAAAGGGFSEGSIDNLRKYKSSELKIAHIATENAYRIAVDFLSTDLSIPSSKHIPYANQIVVLSEIFRILPNPSAIQRSKIQHWFWRSAASGYFGGWNTGNMASDQAAVGRFARGDLEALSSGLSNLGKNIWLTQQFRLNTAHAKILSLILAFNSPIDLLTGQKIDPDKALHYANSKEYHHFFPRDFLAARGTDSRQINSLANFIMLTSASNKRITNRSPSDYLIEAKNLLGTELRNVLQSNLISDAAYEAALHDDYPRFLDERARTISNWVNKLAGW